MDASVPTVIEVRNLDLGYDGHVVMKNLNFSVHKKDIFIVMGVSGCGKSTLLRSLIGLLEPVKGEILYEGKDFWKAEDSEKQTMMRQFGVLYQEGALWSSLTLGENVALPLQLYSKLSKEKIREKVQEKLSLVGLEDSTDLLPSEISGGMRKRAGLARAIALDPSIIFFDEPTSGLDPMGAKILDDLIIKLRDKLEATFVIVTHELASIFSVGNNSIFLDAESKTLIASGNPKDLLADSSDPRVIQFLTRGEKMA